MARAHEKACSFYRRKAAKIQREKVIPMSGVVLEWKTLFSIDNRYSLSKAKLKPECPLRGSTIRAHAAILYTYTYIQRRRKFYLFLEQHTEYSMNRTCSLSLFTVIRVLLLFFLFFFSFFFFFFFSFYFFSGTGRDMESRFLRVTQPAPFVCWLFFKESRFQNF